MELKRKGPASSQDSTPLNDGSASEAEIELYNELVSFSDLSPEEQKAYLERLAKAGSLPANIAKAPSFPAQTQQDGSDNASQISIYEGGETKMEIDTSTWFSDEDDEVLFAEFDGEPVRSVSVHVEKFIKGPASEPDKPGSPFPRKSGALESSFAAERLPESEGVIALVVCSECDSLSDNQEVHCPNCGAVLLEKES